MNVILKAALWITVYIALGFVLADGIALLIRAVRARIIKVWLTRRAIAALVGIVISAICAVYGFYMSCIHTMGAMIAGFSDYLGFLIGEYEGTDWLDSIDILTQDSAYNAAAFKFAGALSVVLAVYLLFSCFNGLYYITERGVLRKGMIKPEEVTAELGDGKIKIYYNSAANREKPLKAYKATPKNLKALERFVQKENNWQDV